MLQKLQNRPTAWLVTIFIVVVAIWVGASQSLGRARSAAADVYWGGSPNVTSVQHDLSEIEDDSRNMIAISKDYLPEDDIFIREVERKLDDVDSAGGVSAQYRAAQELRGAVSDLHQHLGLQALDVESERYRIKLMENIEGRYVRLENNSYNDAAISFNQELEQFPASVLSDMVGIKPLELFA